MTRIADPRGFTLIEMLIAIAIFALLMISVYQTFDQSFRSYQMVEQSRDLNETARLILDRIQDDLQSAAIFHENVNMVFVGEHGSGTTNRPTDRLVFTTLNHLSLDPTAPESDLAEVEYGIRPDPDTHQPLLLRREKPYLDEDHTQGGVLMVLSDHVMGLGFKYFDGTDQLKDHWDARDLGDTNAHIQNPNQPIDDSTTNNGILPQAVETTLVLRDADGHDVAFSSVTRLVLAAPVVPPELPQ